MHHLRRQCASACFRNRLSGASIASKSRIRPCVFGSADLEVFVTSVRGSPGRIGVSTHGWGRITPRSYAASELQIRSEGSALEPRQSAPHTAQSSSTELPHSGDDLDPTYLTPRELLHSSVSLTKRLMRAWSAAKHASCATGFGLLGHAMTSCTVALECKAKRG